MDFDFQPLVLALPGLLPLLPPAMVERGLVQPGGEVYMTRDQALRRAFGKVHEVLERRHLLTAKEKAWLQKKLGRRLPERGYLSWLVYDAKGGYLGMSVLTTEIGKTEPFFLMVSLDPLGRVHHVDVLEYREPRGAEVRRRSYLGRFEGLGEKNLQKALRRIPVIPGATLSCHAVSRAVQKALALHRLYLEEGKRRGTPIHGKKLSGPARLRRCFLRAKAKKRLLPPPSPPKKIPGQEGREKGQASLSLPAMGDLFFAEFEGPLVPSARRALTEGLAALEARWSPQVPGSLTARFNRLPIGASLPLSAAEAQLLASTLRACHRSDRAFSPIRDTPFPERVLGLAPGRLQRLGAGALDPGGFVKGWATDRLRAQAERLGLRVRAMGFRSSFVLPGQGALAISSSARRGPHIRDPRSGTPIPDGPPAVTLAPTALAAELRSTSQFVLNYRREEES